MKNNHLHVQSTRKPLGYSRFSVILDNNNNVIDATILEVNDVFASQLDLTKKDLIGKSKFELFSALNDNRKNEWLDKYYSVSYEGKHIVESVHYPPLDIHFEIDLSSTREGEFILLLQNVSENEYQERLYHDILDHMNDAVCVTDEDGMFIYINTSINHIFGQSATEIYELAYIDNLIGEEYRESIKALDKNKFIKNLEHSIVDKHGNIHELSIDISKIDSGQGKLLFVFRDINEMNVALKEIKDKQESLKTLLNTIPDMIWMKDTEGKFLTCNKEFESFYGVSEKDLLGKTDYNFLSEENADFHRKNDLNVMNRKKLARIEQTIKNRTGSNTIEAEITKTPILDSDGRLTGILGIARDITEKKVIRNELIASNLRLEQLINTAQAVLWEADPETFELSYISNKVEEILGYSRKEWLSNPNFLRDLVYEEDQRDALNFFMSETKKGNSYEQEFRIYKKDKSITWVKEYITLVKNDDGNPSKLVGLMVDIDDQLNDKMELEKYKRFFDITQDNFCMIDKEGHFLDINPQFPKSLGYTPSQLKTKNIFDFIHPEDREATVFEIDHIDENHNSTNFINRFLTYNGENRYYDWNITPHEEIFYAVARDITNEVEANYKRKESEFKYRNLIEISGDAVYLMNENGIIVDVNNTSVEMTGYTKHELIGSFMGMISNDIKTPEQYRKATGTFEINEFRIRESEHIGKDGTIIPVELGARLVVYEGKRFFFTTVRNLTQRKKQEEELREKNALLAKAQQTAKLGYWTLDVTSGSVKCSDEVFRILDESPPQSYYIQIEEFYSYLYPDDRKYITEKLNECIEERKSYKLTHKVITKNGDIKYVEENAEVTFKNNDQLSVIGTMQDITERYLIQQELRLRDDNLNKFFENVHVGIARNAMDGMFLEINPEFERFTGYTKDELNEMSYWDLTPKIYEPEEQNQLDKLKSKGIYGPYQKHYRSKDGKLVPVLLNGVKTMDSHGNEFIWSIVQDITEIEQYRNRLQQDLEKLKWLLYTGKLIAYEVDLDTQEMKTIRDRKEINNASFPIDKVYRFQDFFSIIRSDQRYACMRKLSALEEGRIDSFSCEFQIKNGDHYYWYQCLMSILDTNSKGEPSKMFITLRNIEEEKLFERKKLINEEKERIRISRDIHDSIGQMLVGTRMTLQTMGVKHDGLKDIDELLDDMIKECRLIINNFGISIQESKNLKDTFEKLAEKMNKVYYGEIIISWHGKEHIDDLKTATYIFRIYQEALSNAIKYSHSSQIRINVRNYSRLFMDIMDNGQGFNVKDVEFGFGAINMQERATEIGARIKIDSVVGKGTLVRFRYV